MVYAVVWNNRRQPGYAGIVCNLAGARLHIGQAWSKTVVDNASPAPAVRSTASRASAQQQLCQLSRSSQSMCSRHPASRLPLYRLGGGSDATAACSQLGPRQDVTHAPSVAVFRRLRRQRPLGASPAESPGAQEPARKEVRVGELVRFTLPLLVIWLSGPVMSVLDTAVVGARSSTQLAALGPATGLVDNIAYIFTFLASVTTNLAARAMADGDKETSDKAAATGMAIAAGSGAVLTAALLRFAVPMLRLYLGTSEATRGVLSQSLLYVRIRAWAMPAVTMVMALQGVCLANKDALTPLKVCGVVALINLVADIVLVFGFNQGIRGAAWATTAAQVIGALLLIRKVVPGMSASSKRLPTFAAVQEYMAMGIPTALAIMGQVANCVMVTVAASACGTTALAAHQVLYGMYCLFCPMGDAISQTVQAYLPGLLVPVGARQPGTTGSQPPAAVDTAGRAATFMTFTDAGLRLFKTIVKVGTLLGVSDAALGMFLPMATPFLFTPDTAIWSCMRKAAPITGVCLAGHALTMVLQGAMLASGDATSLAALYALSTVPITVLFVLLRQSTSVTLVKVWWVFALYQVTRGIYFALWVGYRHRHSLFQRGPRKDEPC